MNSSPSKMPFVRWRRAALALVCSMIAVGLIPSVHAQAGSTTPLEVSTGSAGPIRIRQPGPDTTTSLPPASVSGNSGMPPATAAPSTQSPPPAPGEFETYVRLPRFGADLVNEFAGSTDASAAVPPDYLIQTGDEIAINMWGSVDADLRITVDRSGRVTIPRVGPVLLAGVRHGDLQATLSRRVAQVFKNFELSASVGKIRGVRVYVTGYVQRPGAFVVSGLSSVLSAVMRAGGPSSAGSFRNIELRRDGKTVARFDLYDLLLKGTREADRVVHPDDVIHVHPVGLQVGVRGSTHIQAVFELQPGDTLRDLIRLAGGFSAVADRGRVALERLSARNAQRMIQLPLPENEGLVLQNGDLVLVPSAVESALSVERQNRRVKVEGEVSIPGEYLLPPGSTLDDAVLAAGGFTKSAYVYGAQFSRESVRLAQAENYERALRDMETELVRSAASRRVSSAEDGLSQSAQLGAASRLMEKLRALKPTGRVVLQIPPVSQTLPELLLEDQDRLMVPARPTSIGVFGSVFNAGNYLYLPGRTLDDYLRLAGGPTKGADESSTFVVRANGQVVSSRQNSGMFGRGNQISSLTSEPGDTVFVPEEMDKSTVLQTVKDWTLVLYQLGVGAAGVKSAVR